MSDEPLSNSEIILYQTEDGRTRIQCRFENETIWLTQAQIAELFETTPQNVTLHLRGIFAEGELVEAATCKDYLQVRLEGGREVSRKLRHYRLEAILAVGFRVRSHRGTQFRQWAIGRLGEYLVKGFTMDDERLKNPPGKGQKDYFDEQLERIRDIRSSERRFYQKLDEFLKLSEHELLDHAGKISAEQAKTKAELEYERYRVFVDSQPRLVDLDFEKAASELKKLPKPKKPKPPKK